MIERAIENWLINTNERSYQTPFCQVLFNQGHKILYVSPHQLLEQGKDIITKDLQGKYCAFQLKTGKIDKKAFRKYKGELDELVELPSVHPSVDKGTLHQAFLVTNGVITDQVRSEIVQRNENNKLHQRRYPLLQYVDKDILLKEFVDAQGKFIPTELSDFRLFLELFLLDGDDFFPTRQFCHFLDSAILISQTKQDSVSAINSSVIVTSYLLNPFQLRLNHYALFEAWTCLAASIIRYAAKAKLQPKAYNNALVLCATEIVQNLTALRNELLERETLFEGSKEGDGGLVYKARITITLGVLAALEIFLHNADEEDLRNDRVLDAIETNFGLLLFWGESAFPYYFSIIKYLELMNEQMLALSMIRRIVRGIAQFNKPQSNYSFASPYYDANQILQSIIKEDLERELEIELNIESIDFEQFSGTSFLVDTLISMVVRRDDRATLERLWKQLSHIRSSEFVPKSDEDFFSVGFVGQGVNKSKVLNTTQSWGELQRATNSDKNMPELCARQLNFLLFILLVAPYRTRRNVIGLLDRSIKRNPPESTSSS